MKRHASRRLLALVAFFLTLSSFSQARLGNDELMAVKALLRDLAAATSIDESTGIVDKVLSHGLPAAKLLDLKVKAVLASNESRYVSTYGTAVVKARLRLTSKDNTEVAVLRKTLAGLRQKGAALAKGDVVKVGDPALNRLMALLFVTHEAVLEKDKKLEPLRQQLLEVGDWQRKCVEAMATGEKANHKKNGDMPLEPTPYPVTLARLEMLARAEATIGKSARGVLASNERQSDGVDGGEALGILHLNVMRMVVGLKPLKMDTKLCAAARDHSNDMRTKKFFAHESPVPGKKHFTDRAKRFRAKAVAENIAMGRTDAVAINVMWWHSPGHHVNMMNKEHSAMGLGRSGNYWTQLFK